MYLAERHRSSRFRMSVFDYNIILYKMKTYDHNNTILYVKYVRRDYITYSVHGLCTCTIRNLHFTRFSAAIFFLPAAQPRYGGGGGVGSVIRTRGSVPIPVAAVFRVHSYDCRFIILCVCFYCTHIAFVLTRPVAHSGRHFSNVDLHTVSSTIFRR